MSSSTEAESPKATSAPTDPDAEDAREEAAPGPGVGTRLLELIVAPFAEFGTLVHMLGSTLFWMVRPPYRFRRLIEAMEFIGVGSIFIVSLTGFFTGAVLGLQLVDGFRQFGAQNQTGAVVGMAMVREIGPVFSALMVSSRAGSAITTELGSMRVSDQINALVTMAVNPIQFLVVPRVLAGILMVPVLTVLFNLIGMVGAYSLAVFVMGIDPGIFVGRAQWIVDAPDVMQGLIKATIFGATVCLIACRQGFYATGGAAGVGLATNRAVVHSAVAILVLDFVVTALVLG